MIHLALCLIALVVILGFVGATFSAIGAAFDAGAGWGLLALACAGVFWAGVFIAFML